jgi:DNA/RNA-binding domain of Phe-tRNA-synthetase-like protein
VSETELYSGAVAAELQSEFPELRLFGLEVAARTGRSPRGVREQLSAMSDSFRGGQAIQMRQQPIPHAYRVFFRHIGLDPDDDRTPVEAAAVDRLIKGGFRSRNLVDDALTIAVVETGVPVWALDADTLSGPLGLRPAARHEPLGRSADPFLLPEGRLVVADDQGPVAILFGETAQAHWVTKQTTRMHLFTVQVAGVPAIHVEEALWLVEEILTEG